MISTAACPALEERQQVAREPASAPGGVLPEPAPAARLQADRIAFSSAGPNSRPMAIASPVAFIWTPRRAIASGNLSNGQRGSLTTT